MENKITLLVFLLVFGFMNAQKDTTRMQPAPVEFKTLKSTKPINPNFNLKVAPKPEFDLSISNKVNENAVDKMLLNTKPVKDNQYFLMETLPENKDIIGKKYWQNKDVTHQKLTTNVSLGTLKSKTRTVKIECRDHSFVDGDRIKIYQNEQVISNNIGLKGNSFVIYINLEKGYNKIDFEALNMGTSGPNTAEILIYDDFGTLLTNKGWGLNTKQIATIGILY